MAQEWDRKKFVQYAAVATTAAGGAILAGCQPQEGSMTEEAKSVEQRIADERSILNTLALFPRCFDAKDYARLDEVMAQDIVFNYHLLGQGDQQGLETMVDMVAGFLDPLGPTQHLLGSIILDVDGDKAVTKAYAQASHQGKDGQAALFVFALLEYVDEWERRPEGWRITRRDAYNSIMHGDTALFGM
ncbi:MAG: nuclear transport factor 2 family protein [Coriobacteriia bacterium]